MIEFKNTYSKLPERFFERVMPAKFSQPQLLMFNFELAKELGIETDNVSDERLGAIFSGQEILPGSEPLAQAYAAFQFGHMVPQLGDGRAHLLGEVKGYDIQLKGSGQTKFSRNGDGRSALGPVIREYIVSEAMYHLGVPTTRALAAVSTGEEVYRQYPEPGGVFTRVAQSHLRVGTFQFFAFREDKEGLETLLEYSIERHYPELKEFESLSERAIEFLRAVAKKQAELISHWMSLGFIHGVMNTDNFSIAGITIDFGPCAFMDEFKMDKVFSSIDRQGRYAYKNQISIGQWNILRLADCLLPLINEDQNQAVSKVEVHLEEMMNRFAELPWKKMCTKLGIFDYQENDKQLLFDFLKYLEDNELDFTLSFRNLPKLFNGEEHDYPQTKALESFLKKWKERVSDISMLNKINPLYIPRNHQVEKAIDEAYDGDLKRFNDLVDLMRNPYEYNEKFDEYEVPPKRHERVKETFCGT